MSTLYFGENHGLQIGVSNAPITAHVHVPPGRYLNIFIPEAYANHVVKERPETPPSPLSTVPFRRDPDFIDHGMLLDLIHEKCSTISSRVALFGLGGVG